MVTVVIGTYGDSKWAHLAETRAIPSAETQAPVIHRHAGTLAEARNEALELVSTDFVVHLDADDELEPGYIEAMETSRADLRVPMVRQVRRGRAGSPFMPCVWDHRHDCGPDCLREGNWIVIGACVRASIVREVGGWEEWGWSEDWALWARCWLAGASIERVPEAIYRAHFSRASRNHCLTPEETMHWHRQIQAAVFGEQAA